MQKSNEEILKELKKVQKEANKRIADIRKEYGADSWAMKKLYQRLEREQAQGLTPTGRVKATKDMTRMELKETLRATEKFLQSKTSTIEGIEEVRQNQIETIRENLEDVKMQAHPDIENINVTYQDAMDMYGIFEDEDTKTFVDKLGGSPVYRLIAEASEKKMNVTSFREQLNSMIMIENDVDLKKQANRIYNNYVKFAGKRDSKFI